MAQFFLVTLNGLTLAGVYFLVASGLTIIFGLMRVITMAHGTTYLLGGYIGYSIARFTENWFVGALGAAAAAGVLGLLIHQVLLKRFQDDDLRVALVTLGVSLVGADLMIATFGGTATQVPVPQWLQVASVNVPLIGHYPALRLLVLLAAVVIGGGIALSLDPPMLMVGWVGRDARMPLRTWRIGLI